MINNEKLKTNLGKELFEKVIEIKDDVNKLEILSTLCSFLQLDKRKNDFEKLKKFISR